MAAGQKFPLIPSPNDESIDLGNTTTSTDEEVKVSGNDTTQGKLTDKIVAGSGITINELNDGGDEDLEIVSNVTNTDELAKVTTNDTTPSFLQSKIVAGTGIAIAVLNPAGDEDLEISSTLADTDELVKVSSNDTTAGRLDTKIVQGTGITINELNDGANESLQINATGSEQVKVSANDTTADYLGTKLVAGANITLNEQNDGGNETLEIVAAGGGGSISVTDGTTTVNPATTLDFTSGATVTDGGSGTAEIAITGGGGGGGGGGSSDPQSFSETTASLANTESEILNFALPSTSVLSDLETSADATVKFYSKYTQTSPGSTTNDPFWDNVVLHADGEGTHGQNTFTDESFVGASATFNSGAQLSNVEVNLNDTTAFDVTGSKYITFPDSANYLWDIDFTLEFWVYWNEAPAVAKAIMAQWVDGGGTDRNFAVTGTAVDFNRSGTNYAVDLTGDWTQSVWQHFALVWDNTTLVATAYINGTNVGTVTGAGSPNNSTAPLGIGAYGNGLSVADVYVEGIRWTRGVKRYNADFTVPTQPYPNALATTFDPYFDLVTVHADGEGVNGATAFTDESYNAASATFAGGAQLSNAQANLGQTTSFLFDADGDIVSFPSNSTYLVGAAGTDFTLEFWIYPIAKIANFPSPFGNYTVWQAGSWAVVWDDNDASGPGAGRVSVASNVGGRICKSPLTVASTYPYGNWYHIAVTRQNDTFTLYIDGVSVSVGTFAGDLTTTLDTIRLGKQDNGSQFRGHLQNFLFTKGVVKYTVDFAVPTTPFPPTLTYDKDFDTVTLLADGEGTNGQTTFTSQDSQARTLTFNNGAQLSNAQINTNATTTFFFDGVNDHITVPASADFAFGTGEFTIEFFIYGTSPVNHRNPIGMNYTDNNSWYFQAASDGILLLAHGVSGWITQTTNPVNVYDGVWHHIAVSRADGTIKIFVDGIERGSAVDSFNNSSTGNTLFIGSGSSGVSSADRYHNGHLEGIRITKGVGKYISDFPMTPLPHPTSGIPESIPPTIDSVLIQTYNTTGGVKQELNDVLHNEDILTDANTQVEVTNTSGGPAAIQVDLLVMPNAGGGGGASSDVSSIQKTTASLNDGESEIVNFDFLSRGSLMGKILTDVTAELKFYAEYTQISPGSTTNDPFWDNVVVHADGEGINGATAFTDESFNGASATFVGNAQLSNAQTNLNDTTTFLFDGAGDAVEFPNNSIYHFDVNVPFTIEAWVYFNNTGTWSTIASIYDSNSSQREFYWAKSTSENIRLIMYQGGGGAPSDDFTTSGSVSPNTWHHLAVTYDGNIFTIYIDGVGESFTRTISSVFASNQPFRLGAVIGGGGTLGDVLNGHIEGFRYTRGVARNIADFTLPTQPYPNALETLFDPYFELVRFHADGEGINGATAFTSEDDNAYTLTLVGNTQLSNAQTNLNATTTFLFDGTGDYIDVVSPNFSQLDFGTGDGVIEMWIYPTALGGTDKVLLDYRTVSTSSYVFFINTSSQLQVFGDNVLQTASTTALTLNTWQHIALVKQGSTWTYYLDGAADGTFTAASFAAPTAFRIGARNDALVPFAGHMEGIRITGQVPRYTVDFASPPAVFSPALTYDVNYDGVQLRLPFDGTDGDTTTTDESNNGYTVNAAGDVEISNTQSVFGGTASLHDGNGDAWTISGLPQTGTKDFTVECWVYDQQTGHGTFPGIISSASDSGGPDTGFVLRRNTCFVGTGSGASAPIGPLTLTLNTWHHLALVREGDTLYLFKDGVLFGSNTGASINLDSDQIRIGHSYVDGGNTYWWGGLIDDITITIGKAKYTTDFAVPATAKPLEGVPESTPAVIDSHLLETVNTTGGTTSKVNFHIFNIDSSDTNTKVEVTNNSGGASTVQVDIDYIAL